MKRYVNPYNRLSQQQKLFVTMVVKGKDPREAVVIAWPGKDVDPTVAVATVMQSERIKEAITYLTEFGVSRIHLISVLTNVSTDSKATVSQKLSAVKLLGQLGGHIKKDTEPKEKKAKRGVAGQAAVVQTNEVLAKKLETLREQALVQ